MSEDTISWSSADMLEVTIKQPDDFLKVRETLTRIGVASRKDKTLFQSCHILHKQGKYFITHFKELFALDGKKSTLTENDIQRRNTIALLLQDWNLIDVVNTALVENKAPLSQIKVLPFKEKNEWNLVAKYNIGKKPEEVLHEVVDWLDNADYIVGHNILGFDIYLIRGIYKFLNKSYKHIVPKIIDTLSICRGINNDIKPKDKESFLAFQFRMLNIRKKGQRNSLEAVGKSYSIDHDYSKLHDAIVDSELNLKVWNKLKYEIEI